MKLRKPTLLAATLLASLTLAACQAENHDNSTSQTTAQLSPQKTANHSKGEEVTKESNVAEVTTSENSTETQENQPSPVTTKTIDFQALSQGDYSSISGTWSNANGDSFVIDAQGHITTVFEGTSQEGYSIQANHIAENMFLGGLIAPNGQAQASFIVISTGVPTPNTGKTYDQDVICSGQSSLSEDNPYFKVN